METENYSPEIVAELITDHQDGNVKIEYDFEECSIELHGWKRTYENRTVFVLGNHFESAIAYFENDKMILPDESINEILKYIN